MLVKILSRFAKVWNAYFFRHAYIFHAERLEKLKTGIVLPNHGGAFPDILTGLCHLKKMPYTATRSDIFNNPIYQFLLQGIKAVPVFRKRDGFGKLQRNHEAFDILGKHLASGKVVALFPEGVSKPEPGLQVMRKGAARIIHSATKHNSVQVLPVGIFYPDIGNPYGDVVIRYGEIYEVESLDEDNGYRQFNLDLQDRLRSLMMDCDENQWPAVQALYKFVSCENQPNNQFWQTGNGVINQFDVLAQKMISGRWNGQEIKDFEEAVVAAGFEVEDRMAIEGRFANDPLFPVRVIGKLLNFLPHKVAGLLFKLKNPPTVHHMGFKMVYGLWSWLGAWVLYTLMGYTSSSIEAVFAFLGFPLFSWLDMRYPNSLKRWRSKIRWNIFSKANEAEASKIKNLSLKLTEII